MKAKREASGRAQGGCAGDETAGRLGRVCPRAAAYERNFLCELSKERSSYRSG
jgi:hypothetical protein